MNCSAKLCKTGRPGVWEPIVLVWAEGQREMEHQPASISVHNVLLCDDCKNRANPIHFFDAGSWHKIKCSFAEAGKHIPSLKTAKLVFVLPESLRLGGLKV